MKGAFALAKNKEKEIIEKYQDENLEDVMGDRFGRYSKYIIQERALPDVRDGLKPVQRRIIYAMNKDGNTYDKPYRKSAKTVGLVIGNYHPHGDTAVYDAMVRMSQDWKNNIPLIDMHGNNGSIDNDPAAAMRYTEARLSKTSDLFMLDLPYQTVDMVPTFDDSGLEPSVLPCRVPMLLINGATGIAAGYATNIPPFNANEVINAVIYKLKNKKCTAEDLFEIIKGPDFPTGGILQGSDNIKNAMKTGSGKVVLRSKYKINKGKTTDEVIITEIPYEVVKQDLVSQIDNIRIEKKIDSIISVRDESDRKGLRIVLEFKANSNIKEIMKFLFKNTDLQVNISFNMVSIINKTPVLCGVEKILDSFISFRDSVIKKRSEYIHSKNLARLHILEGLIKAVSIMDEVIKTIRASKNKADVIKNLCKKYDFTEVQAESIANMRLYRLSNTDIVELNKEFKNLTSENIKLEKIINNEKERHKIIISECEEILNVLSCERKTVIQERVEELDTDEEALIKEEDVVVTVSKDGYLKRVSTRSFKSNDGDTGLKDGDELILSDTVSNMSDLLVLSDDGRYFKMPVYKINEFKWKDVGDNLSKYTKIYNVKLLKAYILKKEDEKKYIIQLTYNAFIKKTKISELITYNRFVKMPSLMKMKNSGKVVYTNTVDGSEDIAFITAKGLLNYYNLRTISATNLDTVGFVSSTLNQGDELVDAYVGDPKELVLNTSSGNKRLNLKEMRKTKRGNKGINVFANRKTPILIKSIIA